MSKYSLIYLKLRKLQKNWPQMYTMLKNRNVIGINIYLNVSSLTQILMIKYVTLNWVHAFEAAFTVIFTLFTTYLR